MTLGMLVRSSFEGVDSEDTIAEWPCVSLEVAWGSVSRSGPIDGGSRVVLQFNACNTAALMS